MPHITLTHTLHAVAGPAKLGAGPKRPSGQGSPRGHYHGIATGVPAEDGGKLLHGAGSGGRRGGSGRGSGSARTGNAGGKSDAAILGGDDQTVIPCGCVVVNNRRSIATFATLAFLFTLLFILLAAGAYTRSLQSST